MLHHLRSSSSLRALTLLSFAAFVVACGDDTGDGSGGGGTTSATGTTTAGTTTGGTTTGGTTTSGNTATGSGGDGTGGEPSGTGGETGSGGAGTGGEGTGGAGTGGDGTGGAAGACQLADAPMCTTMEMPDEAEFITGENGEVPEVSGGGEIPPGTYVLIRQIVGGKGPAGTRKIVVFGDGDCFTSIEQEEGDDELRLSGTATYEGDDSTVHVTCPLDITITPAYEVLDPIDGKVHYATLNGNDYREWLQL